MGGTAAVVGGGIGGLATAIGLHRAGWDVRVYERARSLPDAGTALGMWPAALRALDALGLGERARAAGRPQPAGALLRADGSRIARVDVGRDPVYLLSRPALLRLLVGGLPDGVVRYATPVDELGPLRDSHDVVVAADGVFSRTRAALFGDRYRARYTGSTAWRGVVPMETGTMSETWGVDGRFGVTPHESGWTNWYATMPAPEGGHAGDGGELATLRDLFGDWHEPIRRVLSLLTEDAILRHDLYELRPPLPSFVCGTVALIGDAAHAMTPDLGRGACEALLDGVALAECLGGARDVHSGLSRYDSRRRRPAQRVAAMSRRVNRLAQARRFTRLRDTAVRLAAGLTSS